jgi:hypothetical protein
VAAGNQGRARVIEAVCTETGSSRRVTTTIREADEEIPAAAPPVELDRRAIDIDAVNRVFTGAIE